MATIYQYTTLQDGDAQSTRPSDVNNLGQVVGSYEEVLPTRTTVGSPNLGFLYENGQYSTISAPGSAFTIVLGSNDVGQLVGDNSPGGFIATDGAFAAIGIPGARYTQPYNINDQGQAVGFYGDATGEHGFLYDKGVFTTIDLPGYGTEVYDINAQGQVVGEYLDSGTHGHGFIYDHGAYISGIDVPGATDTFPAAINDAGVIAGSYFDATGGHGFTDDHGVFTTIDAPGASGTSIAGMNNEGQLVGTFSKGPNSPGGGFLATPAPAAITVGTGSDTLALSMAEDAYKGNAQFTIGVDGQQVGGTLTAASPHGIGQTDAVTVLGDWATGGHSVTINFLNDAYDGSPAFDRNLYLDAATYDGVPVANVAQEFSTAGPVSFGITDDTLVPSAAGTSTTIGTGSDTLVLQVSQDAYNGPAQYSLSIDGQQQGGVLTANALHGSGPSDTVTVLGDFTAGTHTATINFLNDAYGGTPATDRNLYLDNATYDGASVPGASLMLDMAGPQSIVFVSGQPA